MRDILIGIVVSILIVGGFILIDSCSNTYELKATVLENENEIIRFEDENGHIWAEFGNFDLTVGDVVILKMDTMTTYSIYDDEILNIKVLDK